MKLFVLLGLLFAVPKLVSACSCPRPGSPAKEFASSVLVFEGTLIGYTDKGTARFKTARMWKGQESARKLISTARGTTCDARLEVGKAYIVYAYGGGLGIPVANMCNRIVSLEESGVDIQYLERKKNGK
jgi:hypothetical protein